MAIVVQGRYEPVRSDGDKCDSWRQRDDGGVGHSTSSTPRRVEALSMLGREYKHKHLESHKICLKTQFGKDCKLIDASSLFIEYLSHFGDVFIYKHSRKSHRVQEMGFVFIRLSMCLSALLNKILRSLNRRCMSDATSRIRPSACID